MKRYIKGHYFSTNDEMEILRNPTEREILYKLEEVYPFARSANQIRKEIGDEDRPKSTTHNSIGILKKNFFIKELTKKQEKELKNRDDVVDREIGDRFSLLKYLRKDDDRSSKYVIEDSSTTFRPINLYRLAPGYVEYSDDFENTWRQLMEDQLYRAEVDNLCIDLLRFVEKMVNIEEVGNPEIRKIAPTNVKGFNCINCGINHEVRNFIRAILLHLIDQFELSYDFINFLKNRDFLNDKGYEDYKEHYKQYHADKPKKNRTGIEDNVKKNNEDKSLKLRVLSIQQFEGQRHVFLAITRQGKFLHGIIDDVLIKDNVATDTMIECVINSNDSKDISEPESFTFDLNISKPNSYIKIIQDDRSFPKLSELPETKIKDIMFPGKYYMVDAKVIKEPVLRDEILEDNEMIFYNTIRVEDNTGQIPLMEVGRYGVLNSLKVGDRIKVLAMLSAKGGHELRIFPGHELRIF